MEQEETKGQELNLNEAERRNLAKTLKSFTTGFSDGVVRFFDRKEYVTAHGEEANFIARRLLRTENSVRLLKCDGQDVPSVALNRSLFERALRDLLLESADYCVEVYEESKGGGGGWRLSRTASPGKIQDFEEELFRHADLAEAPVVVAVHMSYREGQRRIGVAYVNTSSREMGACEFADDEQFCNLEAALVQLGAKEVAIPKEKPSADGKRLREVVSKCDAMTVERKASDFSQKNLEADLPKLLQGHLEEHRAILEREGAASALSGVIAYSELLADESGYGRHALCHYDVGRFMRLDSAAMRALNVFRGKNGSRGDRFSLYGLLNKCKTPMGKRLLARWLKQPLTDVSELEQRLTTVDALHEGAEQRDALRGGQLRQVTDIERLTRKVERKKASVLDLCKLYQASCALPAISSTLSNLSEALRERYGATLAELHSDEKLGKFEALIEAAVDVSKVPEEYVISASYDDKLAEIQEEKDQVDKRMDQAWEDAASDLNMPKEKVKLEHNLQHGWFWRLTKKEETQVRKKLESKYMILEARKEGTKFTNKQLRQLSEQRNDLDRQYAAQQRQLVDKVVDVASSYSTMLLRASSILAEVDVLAGFAELAASSPSSLCRPTIYPSSENCISLSACRHPCVEAQARILSCEGVEFVPNDCTMHPGESGFQIITGPNMGGKSTFIRQVGVCVLMAQIGCYVPANSAHVSVRDAIFARVGAGDCQIRGLSTFMAEMLEASSILKAASGSSLVIIDELGRGTSTYDGFGLAWAISEHLCSHLRAPTLFATHFHGLTWLQGENGVKNLHVSATPDQSSGKLTMLHELRSGPCSKSFGIECAELAGMPQEVLERARANQAELENEQEEQKVAVPSAGGAKRKRVDGPDDESRGLERLKRFLSDFAALPLPEMDSQEALRSCQGLIDGLTQDSSGNSWLQSTLSV